MVRIGPRPVIPDFSGYENEPVTDSCAIAVGDFVEKEGGDYRFRGTVVSVFTKASGQARCVVENADGLIHIFSLTQLRKIHTGGD